jgi:haloalkane dehalogenase
MSHSSTPEHPRGRRLQTSQKPISRTIKVLDSFMHYLELSDSKAVSLEAAQEGADHELQSPILFLHGMPTCSYLWQQVMAESVGSGRMIAVDLIGMGQSGKPDIDYSTSDHIAYLEAFIEALNLDHITLVMHAWGSVIGLDYASRHQQRIGGLAFYESHLRPALNWGMLSLPVQQMASMLSGQYASRNAIMEKNFLVEELLPVSTLGVLSEADMKVYRQAFPDPASRRPLWQYLMELPITQPDAENEAVPMISATDKLRQDTLDRIAKYSEWLQQTNIPKLMLYAVPGFITTMETVAWCKKHLKNLTCEEIEDALHLAQHSQPKYFAQLLKSWHTEIVNPAMAC